MAKYLTPEQEKEWEEWLSANYPERVEHGADRFTDVRDTEDFKFLQKIKAYVTVEELHDLNVIGVRMGGEFAGTEFLRMASWNPQRNFIARDGEQFTGTALEIKNAILRAFTKLGRDALPLLTPGRSLGNITALTESMAAGLDVSAYIDRIRLSAKTIQLFAEAGKAGMLDVLLKTDMVDAEDLTMYYDFYTKHGGAKAGALLCYLKQGIWGQAQLEKIGEAIQNNVNPAWLTDNPYKPECMEQIILAARNGVTERESQVLKNMLFDEKQMEQIRLGLEQGIDVSDYAKPGIAAKAMKTMRKEISKSRPKPSRSPVMTNITIKVPANHFDTLACGGNEFKFATRYEFMTFASNQIKDGKDPNLWGWTLEMVLQRNFATVPLYPYTQVDTPEARKWCRQVLDNGFATVRSKAISFDKYTEMCHTCGSANSASQKLRKTGLFVVLEGGSGGAKAQYQTDWNCIRITKDDAIWTNEKVGEAVGEALFTDPVNFRVVDDWFIGKRIPDDATIEVLCSIFEVDFDQGKGMFIEANASYEYTKSLLMEARAKKNQDIEVPDFSEGFEDR